MTMFKLAALAACTALVAAQKITNEKGDLLMTTDEGGKVGYKVGSADPVFLNDMVTNDAASEAASYMHLGYQSAYTDTKKAIEAKIAQAQEAYDAQLKANNALQDEIDVAEAAYKAKFGDAAKALKDKINVAANSAGANAVVAVAKTCLGGATDTCSSIGGQVLNMGVSGEIYAGVKGVFKCKWDWKAGKRQVVTAGMGHAASASGAYSAVECETPVFTQAFLTAVGKVSKNKWSTEVTVTQAGSVIKYSGNTGGNTVEFQSTNPVFITDATSGFEAVGKAQAAVIAKAPTELSQIIVHDPDSSAASLKIAFQGVDTSLIKKLEAVKVSEANGKVHYSIRATGTGSKGKKTMSIRMTVTDQNGGTAQQDFKIDYTDVPNLTIKLCTTRGGKVRSWHDRNFWEARSGQVNAGAASNYVAYGNDIKTEGYYQAIGPRLDIEFYQGTTKKAVASYDIAKEFQSISLRDLVSESKYNSKTIGKKALSRSNGKMRGNVLSTQDGGARPSKGDGFVDTNWDLKVRGRNWGRQNDQWDRISWAFNANSNGHTFGGIGGTHRHGSWRVSYEVMPVVGYCTTWNGYGKENHGYNQPGGGHHPFRHCTRHDALKPIDIAITRGQ